jgi:hydrogenase-4 component E
MMISLSEVVLISVALANLLLLGSSRLRWCIKLVAAQGVVAGVLPLLVSEAGFEFRLLSIAALAIALKGYVFPRLLYRSLRHANVKHEVSPLVGQTASALLGVALLAVSFWMAARITPPRGVVSDLVVPVALATILSGLLLIVARTLALTQVVGYLMLENGIYVFGVGMAQHEPMLIEMGILLDVFVAVFVMGIAVFHISRTFDHIDVQQLAELKD